MSKKKEKKFHIVNVEDDETDVDEFIDEFRDAVESRVSNEELLDMICESIRSGIIDDEIQDYLKNKFTDKTKKRLMKEIRDEINSLYRNKIEEEIKIELSGMINEYREEIKEKIFDFHKQNIVSNFNRLLSGDTTENDYALLYEFSYNELKKLLIGNKDFMSSMASKIKTELLINFTIEDAPNEYKSIISKITADVKTELRKDKKIMDKLSVGLMEEITKNIFD